MVFLLSGVSFSNAFISDYNLQKGSFLLGYLGDDSDAYDQDGNIIVKSSLEKNFRASSPINLVKVASADNSAWVSAISTKPEGEENDKTTISKINQKEKTSSDYITVQKSAVMATANLEEENGNYEEQRYGITKHQVKRGETVSSIADYYNISTATILWTNNLRPSQALKPGQVIEILPITGVKHTIVANDTVESVAGAYKADVQEIIIFNELPADGKLTPGKILIVPNGEKEIPADPAPAPTPQPTAPSRTAPQIPQRSNRGNTKVVSTEKYTNPGTVRVGHRFPYGQCTWYVSTRFFVPWGGNAKAWLVNSRAYGYQTGNNAVPGSIMVTNESGYGHVTYVEAVEGNNIIISEMNYAGWARKTTRVVPKGSGIIRGFIYNK